MKKGCLTILVIFCIVFIGGCTIFLFTDSDDSSTSKTSKSTNSKDKKIETQLKNVKEKTALDAKTISNNLKFKANYYNNVSSDSSDMNNYINESSNDELKKWIVVEVKDIDQSSKKVTFMIQSQESIAREKAEAALEKKLSKANALTAFDNYGKTQYPYGFKRRLLDYSVTYYDENTWLVKASVKITNAFNATRETTCEAKVSGTSATPIVSDFLEY